MQALHRIHVVNMHAIKP